jgi:hypothetical protein
VCRGWAASATTRAATVGRMRQAFPVTNGPEDPQPRDIALEQETPELEADLEAQSEPDGDSDES